MIPFCLRSCASALVALVVLSVLLLSFLAPLSALDVMPFLVAVVVLAAVAPVGDVLSDDAIAVVVVSSVLAVAFSVAVVAPIAFAGEAPRCVLPHTASVSLFCRHLLFDGNFVVFLVVLVSPAASFRPWCVFLRALLLTLYAVPCFRLCLIYYRYHDVLSLDSLGCLGFPGRLACSLSSRAFPIVCRSSCVSMVGFPSSVSSCSLACSVSRLACA